MTGSVVAALPLEMPRTKQGEAGAVVPDAVRNMRARGRTDGARGCRKGGVIAMTKQLGLGGRTRRGSSHGHPVTSYPAGGKMEMHLTAAKLLTPTT